MSTFKNTLIQINQYGMGAGDSALGLVLLKNYLTLISEESELPNVICFYNEGVKLVCSNSPVIEILKTLEQKGVKLVICKTCLNNFELLDKVETGIISTMMDIIEFQKVANKVINL